MTTAPKPAAITMDYMGTSFASDEPSFHFNLRLSRCYELAGYAVVMGDLGDGTLVHGSFHGPGADRRIGHAWVLTGENNEQVWEPITGNFYDRDEWYAWTRAEDERTYTKIEAAHKMVEFKHWGRWHDSPHP